MKISKALVRLIVGGLLSSSLFAGDYTYNIKSLVGFEGGYTKIDVENDNPNPAYKGIHRYKSGEAGIKIGAQSDNYRLFLSGRYYFPKSGYDYLTTAGIEFQYLFNFSKVANFFLGANTGIFMSRFKGYGENFYRKVSNSYIGGDAGFNIHLGETLDLEIGGRYSKLNISNIKNNITYTFDNLISGYASLIFKYTMDF